MTRSKDYKTIQHAMLRYYAILKANLILLFKTSLYCVNLYSPF